MLFSRGQKMKNITKIELERLFFNILGFILYAVSCTKTDSHSKYILNFVFGSFLERDHLLNLFILKGYAKRWAKCARISKQKLKTIHRGKKYWITGLVSEKTETLYVELNKTVQAPIVVILQQTNFYGICTLCLWLGIIIRSNQGV